MFKVAFSRNALRTVTGGSRIRIAARYESTRLYSSTTHDNDPDLLDSEKLKNLTGKQYATSTPHPKNAPGWNEHLASASEASVKADREDTQSPEEMQRTTVEYIQLRHSPDEMKSRGESSDERDAIDGPLGQVRTHEEIDEIQGPLGRRTIDHKETVVLQDQTVQGHHEGKNDDHTGSEASVKADRGDT